MSVPIENENPYDTPTVSSDFFHGDIRSGLERMRLRLLDLTGRNRLLNFRHTKKSSLRVVDELPDQLFEQLLDGKELQFRPVPRPRGVKLPAVEEEEQPELSSVEGVDPATRTALQRTRYPSAKDHAEQLGIAISFDLPRPAHSSSAEVHRRHSDREIQTLHYPEELESILRSIGSAARLAVEETGTNMLYMVFGFLEWYEDDASEQARLAPLILVPVTLRREEADEHTRTFRYAVRYSGEDVVANISLQERLRRDFGLDVPSFDDDTPESYFAKLRPLLVKDERWQVRRQLTLTLLSFGKLLMYRDLDPMTWPEGTSPADHPRIKEFFEGIQREGISFGAEYPLDDPALRHRVPPIVDEADSSQHSALVDALEGRNLVIEGPPGTGKSQTITNLIAAALVKGKSVLFVSEKLAALEVVRHRLDKVGLGTFCLELHSHKAQKRQLLDDIDARIKLHRRFPNTGLLDQKLRLVEEDKRRLSDYATLINKPFGRLGQTLYEVIWSAQRRRGALPFAAKLLDQTYLSNAREIAPEELEDYRQRVVQFAKHLETVLTDASQVRAHPWFGLQNSALTFVNERSVLTVLEGVRDVVESLATRVLEQNALVGGEWLPDTVLGVRESVGAIRAMPRDADDIIPALLPKLRQPLLRRRLADFAQWVKQYRLHHEALSNELGTVPYLNSGELGVLRQALARARELAPGAITVGDFDRAVTKFSESSQSIRKAEPAFRDALRWLDADLSFSGRGVTLAARALESIQSCPTADLQLRHPGLQQDTAARVLEAAHAEATVARSQRDRLTKTLDLKLQPGLGDLRRYVVATANARWWSFLSPEYRAAKRTYLAMARDGRKPDRQQLRETFRQLLEFADNESRFRSSRAFREVGGPNFVGIDTPFEGLKRLSDWRSDVQSVLAYAGSAGQKLASTLWSAPTERLLALWAANVGEDCIEQTLCSALDLLGQSMSFLRREAANEDQDWGKLAADLGVAAQELAECTRELSTRGLPSRLRIDGLPEVMRLLTELDRLRALIGGARDVEDALREEFNGADTDLERVARTLAFFDDVSAAKARQPLKEWLLSIDGPVRLVELRRQAEWLDQTVRLWESHWTSFEKLAHVCARDWIGSLQPLESIPLSRHFERAQRALSGHDRLASWLDYLRSRDAAIQVAPKQLVELAESTQIAAADIAPAFAFVAANSLVHEAFQLHSELARFSGLSHEQVRQRFAKLDRESIELYRARAAHAIDQRPIPAGKGHGPVSSYTELHLLEREIEKQKRHVPVRQLMLRAGRALQSLKPCFMMGPLSVAQYLAPGAVKFDLVIMDEASQLRPEDALGAIARAGQVVIVGDRMQLPPTSFFDRIGEDAVDDDEAISAEALSDAESILDVASSVYKPARLLRWHYRSRHGSLIAFSNKEFYKGQLIAFPSPVSKSPAFGVKLIHVSDGVYENRRNLNEAKRVVDTALRHMRLRPTESLGIVTLNAVQRELIEGHLEQRLKTDPIAQRYVQDQGTGLEPFFIKNLENVQGDERDVIYISVTYGRSPSGHVFQRFGPINGATGHRRLNVLFTRARRRVVVFSSMLAEDIQVQPSTAWGVRALKGYLHYARTGVLEQATFSGREPDSDFEIEVAGALKGRGFEVVAQVGVAGYYIDLAVKHPRKLDSFILGVECDGQTYHSSVSARDRDRLRQSVLEDLGWTIHRVWSTDWFKQTTQEVDRIVARIDERLREEEAHGVSSTDFGLEESGEDVARPAIADDFEVVDDEWAGEEEMQFLSTDEARRELVRLRGEIARDFPGSDAKSALLRDPMLEVFLRAKPATRDDWLKRIPLDMRLETDGEQLKSYLSRVLEITGRLMR